jgi:hypothetical protein
MNCIRRHAVDNVRRNSNQNLVGSSLEDQKLDNLLANWSANELMIPVRIDIICHHRHKTTFEFSVCNLASRYNNDKSITIAIPELLGAT